MKVDDYGRFYSDVRLLKASLFPLKTDIRGTDLSRWLTECEKAGLIVTYLVASKGYLQITDFNQRLRQKNEKYPGPEKSDKVMTDECRAHDRLKRNEVETEVETETNARERAGSEIKINEGPKDQNPENPPPGSAPPPPGFAIFWDLYGKKVDKAKCERKWEKLSKKVKKEIIEILPAYVASTPNVKYRKNPLTWLNGQCWQDEIINNGKFEKNNEADSPGKSINFDNP